MWVCTLSQLKTRLHDGNLSKLLMVSCIFFVIMSYLQHLYCITLA